nr:hypothetical protein [uncultured Undibacterium sp.]
MFSPHPYAPKSTCEAAPIILQAAISAGAPPDIIGGIKPHSLDLTDPADAESRYSLDTCLILATGV